MASEQERNIEIVRKGYAAFQSGDTDTLMSLADEGIEWHQPGQSTLSGTYSGRTEFGELLRRMSEKSLRVQPTRFFADGDTVAVLAEGTVDGEPARECDVLTLRNGRITRAWTYPDTAQQERVYGRRSGAGR